MRGVLTAGPERRHPGRGRRLAGRDRRASPTSSPRPNPASACCNATASGAWRRRTWPGSASASTTATTSSSRWTPTSRTGRRTCRPSSTGGRVNDLTIGSRYIPGGGVTNWGRLARGALQGRERVRAGDAPPPVKDATSGFRGYRRDCWPRWSRPGSTPRATGSRSSSSTGPRGWATCWGRSRSRSGSASTATRRSPAPSSSRRSVRRRPLGASGIACRAPAA